MRAFALFVVLALCSSAHASRGVVRLRGGGAKTVVGVVGFSEDGTRALLQQKEIARGAAVSVAVTYVVVDGRGALFQARVSEAVHIRGGGMFEEIDNATCRSRVSELERALADFRSVKVRESACSKPQRADLVVELEDSSPTPLPLGEELAELQRDSGAGLGLYFVNEDGPLVVVIRPDDNDIFGKSNEALTFLREDPRINNRWPDP